MGKPDGGPAFPVRRVTSTESDGYGAIRRERTEQAEGMSLRDYFAAHAPAEPQAWFEPVLSRPWSQEPTLPEHLHPDTVRTVKSWRRDPHWDLDLTDARHIAERDVEEVRGYVAAIKAHWATNDELQEEKKAQRLIQWPYAWADAILAEREK